MVCSHNLCCLISSADGHLSYVFWTSVFTQLLAYSFSPFFFGAISSVTELQHSLCITDMNSFASNIFHKNFLLLALFLACLLALLIVSFITSKGFNLLDARIARLFLYRYWIFVSRGLFLILPRDNRVPKSVFLTMFYWETPVMVLGIHPLGHKVLQSDIFWKLCFEQRYTSEPFFLLLNISEF